MEVLLSRMDKANFEFVLKINRSQEISWFSMVASFISLGALFWNWGDCVNEIKWQMAVSRLRWTRHKIFGGMITLPKPQRPGSPELWFSLSFVYFALSHSERDIADANEIWCWGKRIKVFLDRISIQQIHNGGTESLYPQLCRPPSQLSPATFRVGEITPSSVSHCRTRLRARGRSPTEQIEPSLKTHSDLCRKQSAWRDQ